MISLIIKLLLAHILGDFVFQSNKSVKDKQKRKWKSKYLYLHGLVHLGLLVIILGFDFSSWDFWRTILLIVVSHSLIDGIKLHLDNKKNSRYLFFIDQALHLFVIAAVTYWWLPYELNVKIIFSAQNLLFLTALLLCTFVSSVIIKVSISKWEEDLEEEKREKKEAKSLIDAGKYIGIIERLFVFTFVILNHWAAIGFLITAKSVFRFGDLSKGKNRKLTEYILIGTLLSFGLAILTGLLFKMLLPYLQ